MKENTLEKDNYYYFKYFNNLLMRVTDTLYRRIKLMLANRLLYFSSLATTLSAFSAVATKFVEHSLNFLWICGGKDPFTALSRVSIASRQNILYKDKANLIFLNSKSFSYQ